MRGVVYKSTGSWYLVKTSDGEYIQARIKGIFRLDKLKTTNPIAVGDIVNINHDENNDWVIDEIAERRNYIIRQSPKNRTARHIIASNLDQLVIVATIAQPRTSSGFIDRCLTTAEAYQIPAIIIFNKQDLLREKDLAKLEEYVSIYKKAGYTTLNTSIITKENISEFKQLLTNKTSLIAGHSGVGKSSLINSILPDLDLRTNIISSVHQKGTHTTTFAEMHDLEFGGRIIDTPGIKEFGVLDIEKHELSRYFPDFLPFIPACKYSNCLHINEPQCGIIDALEKGALSFERYKNYCNILEDIDGAMKSWELK
ncbi:MAG: ribosome small subunit-dependent GTPase A [Chitinophagales bacterium]|nr:ribosome small subunit-dependent GTPase A [Chitinophagales bacterium]